MDDRVIRSMARWPNVPAVFGWLALDGRGRWLLKGESITNRAAVGFICRNYTHDEDGRWYFQNGPQRVFVELHMTPWVFRLGDDGSIESHTNQPIAAVNGVFMDDNGIVLVDTPDGVGCVDDRDLELFSRLLTSRDGALLDDDRVALRVEQLAARQTSDLALRIAGQVVSIEPIAAQSVACRFRFVREPCANEEQAG